MTNALGLITLTGAAAWLAVTADSRDDFPAYFGFWKNRHFLPALVMVWLGGALLALARSRRLFFGHVLATILLAVSVVLCELIGVVGLVDYRHLFERVPAGAMGALPVPGTVERGEAHQDLASLWGRRLGSRSPRTPETTSLRTSASGRTATSYLRW